MRQETKVIYSAIESYNDSIAIVETKQSDSPPIGVSIEAPKASIEASEMSMSYRSLKKGARDIMELNEYNLNELCKQQKNNFPKIESAKFVKFKFGAYSLLGEFKISFKDNETNNLIESCFFVSWDSATLNIC